MLLVCGDVIFRYIFNDSAAWVMELEWHLFALIFLLGAGYAFRHDRHVRVDLFYARMSARDQALVNAVGGLVLLIPWCLVLIWLSWDYAQASFLVREGSPDPGGLPARYLIKFAVPIAMALLLLQAIASVAEAWQTWRSGRKPEPEEDGSIHEGL
jgi:TRAP-type mannitol/chloroaromatic compound transport system permease small subunit